jgi:hypothetical protein
LWFCSADSRRNFATSGCTKNPKKHHGSSDGMRKPVSAGCDTLPMFDVLEAQEKETGNEED